MIQQPAKLVPLHIMIASLIILISAAVIVIAKAPWAQGIRSYIAANGPAALHMATNEAHKTHLIKLLREP